MSKNIIVIGAGPKAIALACKAKVLSESGRNGIPTITIIEKQCIGSHWDGNAGYTDGKQVLCTMPEKDLGFPYRSIFGTEIDREMLAFSWHRYLIERGYFSTWVDRGRQPPTHFAFAGYLSWAAKVASANVQIGEVVKIESDRSWKITVRTNNAGGGESQYRADGLVITGPGSPRRFPRQPREHSKILDGRTFWMNPEVFSDFTAGRIIVIGSGETAAAIVMELTRRVEPTSDLLVTVINREPTIFSRGESYEENKYFEDQPEWSKLPLALRQAFIERTDRGVFSLKAKEMLNRFEYVKHKPMSIKEVSASTDDKVHVHGSLIGETDIQTLICDYLIVATSFNPMWFLGLLSPTLRRRLGDPVGIEERIGRDLAVSGMTPPLHLPMLSALSQGPGLPNLTCLGNLSDRILSRYCVPGQESLDSLTSLPQNGIDKTV